jgi:hypothetical protein
MLQGHMERHFPKTCPNCNRCFEDLRSYIVGTKRVGQTISYDAEIEDWKPQSPLGAIAMTNCPCGSTLALTTHGMDLPDIHAILAWVKEEKHRQGCDAIEIIDQIRDEIRKRILA